MGFCGVHERPVREDVRVPALPPSPGPFPQNEGRGGGLSPLPPRSVGEGLGVGGTTDNLFVDPRALIDFFPEAIYDKIQDSTFGLC